MADARTDLTRVIREVTDGWEEPLDEVHDVPQIVNAVLAWLADYDHTTVVCDHERAARYLALTTPYTLADAAAALATLAALSSDADVPDTVPREHFDQAIQAAHVALARADVLADLVALHQRERAAGDVKPREWLEALTRLSALSAAAAPQDEWCREESCRWRNWRSGSMPTHKRGPDCAAPQAAGVTREGLAQAMDPVAFTDWTGARDPRALPEQRSRQEMAYRYADAELGYLGIPVADAPAAPEACGWCSGPAHEPGDCAVAQQAEAQRLCDAERHYAEDAAPEGERP